MVIKSIYSWLKKMGMSAEERFLCQATDLADLENRMSQLRRKGFPY
jgi:hypothetical protein